MTYNDLLTPDRRTVWRHLRSLRHDPPGYAGCGVRRTVFASALEQAEELFTAGATIGHASQPILSFYGISQAGRAIAAASRSATGNGWRLTGHGIKVRNLAQNAPLAELIVADDGTGSFTQLASSLHSGSLPTALRWENSGRRSQTCGARQSPPRAWSTRMCSAWKTSVPAAAW
jgi:hypothetical protein